MYLEIFGKFKQEGKTSDRCIAWGCHVAYDALLQNELLEEDEAAKYTWEKRQIGLKYSLSLEHTN